MKVFLYVMHINCSLFHIYNYLATSSRLSHITYIENERPERGVRKLKYCKMEFSCILFHNCHSFTFQNKIKFSILRLNVEVIQNLEIRSFNDNIFMLLTYL